MTKINLVIADFDKNYVSALVKFILNSYSGTFNITSFTEWETLSDYISKEHNTIDVLLIGPDVLEHLTDFSFIKTVIKLEVSGSILKARDENVSIKSVSKYQNIDKLVANILEIYADVGNKSMHFTGSKINTKVLAFYSPIGGSGKTTLSISFCCHLAKNGLSIFYLNLERFASTPIFFDCADGSRSLSNVFFYIKEKNKNISLKLESQKSTDNKFKVNYFNPLENSFEYDDITEEDIANLINEMKMSLLYDVIVIDMNAELEKRNISIMDYCDKGILVLKNDSFGNIKTSTLIRDLEKLQKKENIDILGKTLIISNMYDENIGEKQNSMYKGHADLIKIPVIHDLLSINNLDMLSNNSVLQRCMNQIQRGIE